jgi:hypothetical protein
LDFGVNGWKRKFILAHHELSDELAKLSLNELAKLFPCPVQPEEKA